MPCAIIVDDIDFVLMIKNPNTNAIIGEIINKEIGYVLK
jgi:hypothetical protein